MAYQPTAFRGEMTAEELHFYLERELLAISRELTGSEGSALPPIFDIRDFMGANSGSEIAGAGRRAIAAAIAGGDGGRIYIPSGTWTATYDSDATVIGDGSSSIWDIGANENIWFEGDGFGTLVELHNGGTANINLNLLSWVGPSGSSYTTSGNAVRGDVDLVVGTGQGIVAGDKLQISGDDSAGFFHFCVVTVKSYNSGSGAIVLRQPLPISVPVANLDVLSVAYISGGGARNLRINATNAKQTTTNSARGIVAWNTQQQLFENIWFEEFSGNAPASCSSSGMFMFIGYENTLRNLHASKGGSAGGDDIYMTWQHGLSTDNLRETNPAGFGIGYLAVTAGLLGRHRVDGEGTASSARGMKLAGVVECTFQSVVVQGGLTTGLAVTEGSERNLLGKVIAVNDIAITASQNVGVWFSDQNNKFNYIEAIHSVGWADRSVEFYTSDTGNTIGYCLCETFLAQGSPHVGMMANVFNTVADLPTITTGGFGFGIIRSHVVDATSATFRAAATGGGSNNVPVHYDGGSASWRIG
jgi:hypothetical protein